jgi:hypothetical protein
VQQRGAHLPLRLALGVERHHRHDRRDTAFSQRQCHQLHTQLRCEVAGGRQECDDWHVGGVQRALWRRVGVVFDVDCHFFRQYEQELGLCRYCRQYRCCWRTEFALPQLQTKLFAMQFIKKKQSKSLSSLFLYTYLNIRSWNNWPIINSFPINQWHRRCHFRFQLVFVFLDSLQLSIEMRRTESRFEKQRTSCSSSI